MEINKLHDYEMEASVLGALISEPSLMSKIEFEEEIFYKVQHKTIAWAVKRLLIENKSIDKISVVNFLRASNRLEDAGGAYEVGNLDSTFTGMGNVIHHYYVLKQLHILRKLAIIGHDLKVKTLTDNADPFYLIQEFEQKISSLTENLTKYLPNKIEKLNQEGLKRLEKIRNDGMASGVYIDFEGLQQKTGGWQNTELTIIAARPGMGKTSLALQFLIQPAIKRGVPTAFFSLEMGDIPIVSRIQSILSGFNASNILRGNLSHDEIKSLAIATQMLNSAPIYIDSTPAMSILEFKQKARKLKRENRIELIIIDYLQLMRGNVRQNREQEISSISRALKETAKELDIPIIALSQLSRAVEARGGDKKPLLSDLRESGAIEQDADMVMFIHRPEYYGQNEFETGEDAKGKAELIIAKNRNGGLGSTIIGFDASNVRFYDLKQKYELEPNKQF